MTAAVFRAKMATGCWCNESELLVQRIERRNFSSRPRRRNSSDCAWRSINLGVRCAKFAANCWSCSSLVSVQRNKPQPRILRRIVSLWMPNLCGALILIVIHRSPDVQVVLMSVWRRWACVALWLDTRHSRIYIAPSRTVFRLILRGDTPSLRESSSA